MTCDDQSTVNPAQSMTFTLNAVNNLVPTVGSATVLAGIEVLKSANPIYLEYDISGIFTDPEGEPLYYDVLDNTGAALDSTKIIGQVQDGQLLITIVDSNTPRTYNLVLRAADPLGQRASTPFSVLVYPCDVTCNHCTGKLATQCIDCSVSYPNIYVQPGSTTCQATCPAGTYNNGNHVCLDCPEGCATCDGPDVETQCLTCDTNYFKLAYGASHFGCYYFCPEHYVVSGTSCIQVTETQNYLDCLDFIGNFTTATNDYVESFEAMLGNAETVTCAGGKNWKRTLAAQCRQTNEATPNVFIQVATNSLPPHCTADGIIPITKNIKFEVKFSVPKTSITAVSMNTQILVNTKQCNSLDWTNVDNLGQTSTYGYQSAAVTPIVPLGIVGVAVNGVPIHAGISENLEDFIYPITASKRISVDECLGALSKTTTHFYQYYSFSPCIYQTALIDKSVLQQCDSLTNCPNDPAKYAVVLNYPKNIQLRKNYFGLALDGHMISGPYKTDYTLLQPCDVDACNGYTSNGHYVYGATLFYPYTVACWGPATTQSMYPATCSNNNNVCLSQSYSLFGLTLNFVLIIFATLLMFY